MTNVQVRPSWIGSRFVRSGVASRDARRSRRSSGPSFCTPRYALKKAKCRPQLTMLRGVDDHPRQISTIHRRRRRVRCCTRCKSIKRMSLWRGLRLRTKKWQQYRSRWLKPCRWKRPATSGHLGQQPVDSRRRGCRSRGHDSGRRIAAAENDRAARSRSALRSGRTIRATARG